MERQKAEAVLEAVLFTMGDSVELTRLAQAIDEDTESTRSIIEEMRRKYQEDDRGVFLVELDGAYQMCAKGELYEYLVKVVKTPGKYVLTDSALETLSIVAYKQPVTRMEVEKIRGVNSDHAINRLLELDLVRELGRLDAPGRPLLFGTTEQFLRSFGLKDLSDLPEPEPEQIEDFRHEAEEEAAVKLEV